MTRHPPSALAAIARAYGVTLEEVTVANEPAWKGCCPFHAEKTPSFYVYVTDTFLCLGCGASGDGVEFVRRIEEAKTAWLAACAAHFAEHYSMNRARAAQAAASAWGACLQHHGDQASALTSCLPADAADECMKFGGAA
ncbi:CHC2 zinc finger domain-containing protein [Azospirillum rugosum]|uniref:Zinc finger CHC2-type domain-containing protein n=1 Tax=Azospirillum rugosum TaxID=416170 RepID=A0ABS4SFP9_9PROT|nr:hypothetical protein [Azospirillum rugosum]MDQ0524917.1 hypothetical protein [Azospirillum rugosum]